MVAVMELCVKGLPGVPVICEKTKIILYCDAARIRKCLVRLGEVAQVALTRRYGPIYRRVGNRGAIGIGYLDVHSVEILDTKAAQSTQLANELAVARNDRNIRGRLSRYRRYRGSSQNRRNQ